MHASRRAVLTSGLTLSASAAAATVGIDKWGGSSSAATLAARTGSIVKFPKSFLWGVGTSGFQSEGYAPDSNWTRYIAERATGKSPCDPYGNSVDFRHRYPDDLRRAHALGVGVFRTSVEWARIEPVKGVRDPAGIAFYDKLVHGMRALGMRPMLTLDHWVYPGWVADQGGWANADTVTRWLDNVRFVVDRYKNLGVLWITINEASGYMGEEFANRGMNLFELAAMRTNMVRAHRAGYDLIHGIDRRALVSTNIAYYTGTGSLFDNFLFNKVTDKIDFIGLDYYYGASLRNMTAFRGAAGKPWTIKSEPEGLYYVLKHYHQALPHLPLYIVENGLATDNGAARPDGYSRATYLRDHLYWLQRAIAEGVPVMGYNTWSLTDNYEWGSYNARYGLYTVNALTDPSLTRRATGAVPAYRDIIGNHGVPRGYRPVQKPAYCSLDAPILNCTSVPATPAAP